MNALLVAALEREHNVFVQPAAGNAGTAIGAVLHASASIYGQNAGRELAESLSRTGVLGGRNQAGARELQAAF